jgi:hypothetical protein
MLIKYTAAGKVFKVIATLFPILAWNVKKLYANLMAYLYVFRAHLCIAEATNPSVIGRSGQIDPRYRLS